MFIISKKKKIKKNKIFLKSFIGNLNIVFIDKIIKIPMNIKIYLKKDKIYFKGPFGIISWDILNISNLLLLKKTNYLFFNVNTKKKKSILNLYFQLIMLKLKGVSKNNKLHLLLKGIGFKAFIKQPNILELKVGYSHSINIFIPKEIKILIQTNLLICQCNDLIKLTQFIHFVKSFKKPELYKGKGLLLKNENILLKEGKKSKK